MSYFKMIDRVRNRNIRIKAMEGYEELYQERSQHSKDAGFDLRTRRRVVIAPQERILIPTGIALKMVDNAVGIIKEKSGLALKGIEVKAGVIDSGYEGEIKVILKNDSVEPIRFKKGDKIAQLLIYRIVLPRDIRLPSKRKIAKFKSKRGAKGFGSTGES